LDGINAYDATLHIDGSGCWLFCSTSSWGASTSDRLELFHAPQLLGPWRPCPAETRVFDARIARPAGKLFRDKARLIRPAQDCSRIYGGAIQLCGVERLSEAKFTQTLISRLEPEDQSLFWGCHTYNTHGAIETIDVFGYSHARREVTLRKKSAREAHTVHARVAGALV
jgi:hypothetical protein